MTAIGHYSTHDSGNLINTWTVYKVLKSELYFLNKKQKVQRKGEDLSTKLFLNTKTLQVSKKCI